MYTAGRVFMCVCLQSGLPKNILPCDSLTEASYVYKHLGRATGYERRQTGDQPTFPMPPPPTLEGDG